MYSLQCLDETSVKTGTIIDTLEQLTFSLTRVNGTSSTKQTIKFSF
jgi:hypothetical protein